MMPKDLMKGISLFGMASDNELKEIESTVRNLKENDKIARICKEQ